MTDQELKDLVAKTAQTVAALSLESKETERQFKTTEEQFERQFQTTEEQFKLHNKELADQFKETDRRLRLLGEQLGGLGNKFGSFTEGLAYPSLYRLLTEEFHLENVDYRCRRRRNGAVEEFDLVASSNGTNQRVFLVEIKSHLTEGELKKFEKQLGEFLRFFPEQRGKALYGLIAAVDVAHGLALRVARRGIYLALAHDGTFALASPHQFKPKRFS